MMSAEDDQKLRRRAKNDRYRQGKGKEPQQQARIAASNAKYWRGKAKEPEKARIAASNGNYRRGKAKEPEPQARIAASTAKYWQGKFKEPDQEARKAASAAKYGAGQGCTEENKKKIKVSQEACMNKLRKSEDYPAKRKISNTKYRDCDEGKRSESLQWHSTSKSEHNGKEPMRL